MFQIILAVPKASRGSQKDFILVTEKEIIFFYEDIQSLKKIYIF